MALKYKNALLGICIFALLLSLAGIIWRDSERQYVAMTNLGFRLKVLQEVTTNGAKLEREDWPAWEVAWKPMIAALQGEAQRAGTEWRGLHIPEPMYERIARFAVAEIGSEAALKNAVSQLDFTDDAVRAKFPIVFSRQELLSAMPAADKFRAEVAGILSSGASYSSWLAPILHEQRLRDRSVACKTQKEIDALRVYSERLRSRCADAAPRAKDKWKVCGGGDEPVARQMKELQMTTETNLKKFKTRWAVKDGEDICSGIY